VRGVVGREVGEKRGEKRGEEGRRGKK